MSRDRRGLRGVVLSEDKRTERFFVELLRELGFRPRSFRFETAPTGRGSGESWVAKRYPAEVAVLRRKSFQRGLRLVAVRDADLAGVQARKQELDDRLREKNLPPRGEEERIALPVPARNIETWLMALLGHDDLDESTDFKRRFEKSYGREERTACRRAARAWREHVSEDVPSLADGREELDRLDP